MSKNRQPSPTPQEIRRACEAIQKRWSERQFWRRSGHTEGPRWSVPMAAEPRFHIETVRGE